MPHNDNFWYPADEKSENSRLDHFDIYKAPQGPMKTYNELFMMCFQKFDQPWEIGFLLQFTPLWQPNRAEGILGKRKKSGSVGVVHGQRQLLYDGEEFHTNISSNDRCSFSAFTEREDNWGELA